MIYIAYFIDIFQKRYWLFLLFSVSVLIGFLIVSPTINDKFENSSHILSAFNLWVVFKNNSIVFILLLLGFASFGIINFFTIFINGFIVGIVIKNFISHFGVTKCLAAFLPHGVIEILVYIEVSSQSFQLAQAFINDINNNFENPTLTSKINVKYIIILYILLVVAALIEVYVTPVILNSLN